MQDQIEQDQTTSTTPADQEDVSAWLDAASEATSRDAQDWPLHALSAIYGISRVMRRLGDLLEPGEQQALAEAIECLSDEMLEQGCCA